MFDNFIVWNQPLYLRHIFTDSHQMTISDKNFSVTSVHGSAEKVAGPDKDFEKFKH